MEVQQPSHFELELKPGLYCTFRATEEVNADGWRKHRCTRCGYVSVFIPPWSNRIVRSCKGFGLGDLTAMMLDGAGITKARVAWVRQVVLGEEGCGGCEVRQEQLNEFGHVLGIGRPPDPPQPDPPTFDQLSGKG